MTQTIAFQGRPGAYSDLACRTAYPDMAHAALRELRGGDGRGAGRPRRAGHAACENSLAGRVADIHHLLPGSGLFVVGEHFQRVEHCLLASAGATHRRA